MYSNVWYLWQILILKNLGKTYICFWCCIWKAAIPKKSSFLIRIRKIY
jgi:hypothetical protein